MYSYVNGNLFNPANVSDSNDTRKNDIDFDKEIDKIDENLQQESDKNNEDKKDESSNQNGKSGNNVNNPKNKGQIFISSSTRKGNLAYTDNANSNKVNGIADGDSQNVVYVDTNAKDTSASNNSNSNNSSTGKNNNSSNSGNNSNNGGNSSSNNSENDDDDNEPEKVVKPPVASIGVPKKSQPEDAWDAFGMSRPSYDPNATDNASKKLVLSISAVLPDDYFSSDNKIFNGEEITEETLLNQVRAYASPLNEDGSPNINDGYRIRSFSENFIVKDHPKYAYDGFSATFCFRATSVSPWQEETLTFQTVKMKLVMLTYEDGVFANYTNKISCLYPNDGEQINMLRFYDSIVSSDNDLTMLFRGWSLTPDGEPLDDIYTATGEGLVFLYPAGFVEISPEFKEKLDMHLDEDTFAYEYWQTLYNYTGTSSTLRIPNYTYNLQFESKHAFDKVVIPATLKGFNLKNDDGVTTLEVKNEYVVSNDNKYFSTLIGMLTSKEQDKIYVIPTSITKATFGENVKSIHIRDNSNIKELHLSGNIPQINIENLDRAKIYVPRDSYYDYLVTYGAKLGNNEFLIEEDSTQEPEYIYADGAVYSSDSTILYSITSDAKGIFIVPSCVKRIASGAMDNCPDVDTLIFKSDIDLLADNSINVDNLERIYFLGKEKAPSIYQNAISNEDRDVNIPVIYVQQNLYDDYNTLLTDIYGENYEEVILQSDELELIYQNDSKYLHTNEGDILLKAPANAKDFNSDSITGANIVEIGSGSFGNNENIVNIIFGESVKTIGKYALENCTSLETVQSKSTDEITVKYAAFFNDKALRFVTFDAEYGTIDEDITNNKSIHTYFAPYNAYNYDTVLLAQYFDYSTPYGTPYLIEDAGDGKVLYAYNEYASYDNGYVAGYIVCRATSEISGEISFPDGTYIIEDTAFKNCTKPFTISNIDKLEIIGYSSFSNSGISGDYYFPNLYYVKAGGFELCNNLTSLKFGSQLYILQYAPFDQCTNLKTVEFETAYPFTLSSAAYLQPYSFGVDIGINCGGFRIILSDLAEPDYFIDQWKYYFLGKDVFFDYGNLTEEEDITGQNMVRNLLGMELLPMPETQKPSENKGEELIPNENRDEEQTVSVQSENENNEDLSQSSSNVIDNETEQGNISNDENSNAVDISEDKKLADNYEL